MTALPERATATFILSLGLAACTAEAPPEPVAVGPALSHAALGPTFGAKASGSELATPGIVTDGGPGSGSASISRSNFQAHAAFVAGATYLPELKAFSQNTTAENDDDITQSAAEAYQVFTSAIGQTIDLDIRLSGVVVDGATDVSYVLADVYVYGGVDFEVIESPICEDGSLGQYLFDGTYFCGSRLGRANLFIPVGDVTLPDVLSFTVAAGAPFGVYAVLRAASSGGSADATQTLALAFQDDQHIAPVEPPGPPSDLVVEIDLKAGSDPNCLNVASRGTVPVAILGSALVDVQSVDRTSLMLNGLEVRLRPNGPMCAVEDVNQDGDQDLTCHFQADADAWITTGGTVTLTGTLLDGTVFSGTDAVCFVPAGR